MAETYETRLARLRRAAALQEGDRVPFAPKLGNLMASAYGLSVYDTMKDVRTVIPCASRFLDEFQPDMVWPVSVFPLDPCEYLGAGYIRMPGPTHGLPLDASFQMMDGTYMEDDEFDEFLLDPTHFLITKVMPRKYKALGGLAGFYGREIYDMAVLFGLAGLTQPETRASLEALLRAGELSAKYLDGMRQMNEFIVGRGFPIRGSAVLAPFDAYADSLRGLVQALMDVKLYPDEVLAVTERIERMNTDRAIAAAKRRGDPFLFMPLHAGGDEFMSRDDYAAFYWPGLKRTIEKIIAAGITPYVFCEGKYSTRLDFLQDVPKGKVIYMFEKVDIVEAKQKLEGIACVCGNLPTALLISGTAEQVVTETKRMLDACAPGGGFIMDCSIQLDEANMKNFAAWYETTITYGKY